MANIALNGPQGLRAEFDRGLIHFTAYEHHLSEPHERGSRVGSIWLEFQNISGHEKGNWTESLTLNNRTPQPFELLTLIRTFSADFGVLHKPVRDLANSYMH